MRRPNLALKRMNGFGLSKWRRSRVFVGRRAFARRPGVSYVLIEIRHTGILTRLGWSMNVSCRLHAEHIVVMQRVERCDEGSSNRARHRAVRRSRHGLLTQARYGGSRSYTGCFECTSLRIGEEWTAANEGRDTWSPFQVLGHLTHVEESDWMDRTTTILASSEPTAFEPIDRGAGFARFEGWSITDLLEHFKVIRTLNLEQLEALVSVNDLERIGIHPTFGTSR